MPSSFFVTAGLKPALPIPRSCIEGAEYIIQSIAQNNMALPWLEGQENLPHVIAEFGKGMTINITTENNFYENGKCLGLSSYNFDNIALGLGHGIILVNNHTTDVGNYNMHLGAVVAIEGGYYYFSDVAETGNVIMTANWDIMKIKRLSQFRGNEYSSGNYAMGLLRT